MPSTATLRSPTGRTATCPFIGSYDAPKIGVEFSLKTGWDDEEVVYDFLKVLDPRTPFTTTFSHNLIIRENNLAAG